MAHKKTALAQNATQTRVLPAEVVRPVFLTKRAQERALEQEQEERTWDRVADVAKAVVASPVLATVGTALLGGVGGVLANDPWTVKLTAGPTGTDVLEEYPSGYIKRVRYRCDFQISNGLSTLLRVQAFDVPLGLGTFHFPGWGWPVNFSVTTEHSRPEGEAYDADYQRRERQDIITLAEKLLRSHLRAMGFAVGVGGVLIVPAVARAMAQTVSGVVPG